MTIQFDDAAEELGRHLTNDAFTQACNEPGNASIVIGFAPNQCQAETALEEHMAEGAHWAPSTFVFANMSTVHT